MIKSGSNDPLIRILVLETVLSHLNFLKTTEKELNGAAIRLNRRKMGDILLIKKRKSIGPTQGKCDYKKIQEL